MSTSATYFDEMGDRKNGVRDAYKALARWMDDNPSDFFKQRSTEAELIFQRLGITFVVYGEEGSTERLIPFDIIPRAFTAAEWSRLAEG